MQFWAILCLAWVTLAFVKLDYEVTKSLTKRSLSKRSLNRRSQPFQVGLEYDGVSYLTKIKVGSNGQEVNVTIDTGSADLWIMAQNADCVATVYRKRDETSIQPDQIEPTIIQIDSFGSDTTTGETSVEMSMEPIFTEPNTPGSVVELSSLGIDPTTPTTSVQPHHPTFGPTQRSSIEDGGYTKSATSAEYFYSTVSSCWEDGTFATAESDSFQLNDSAPPFEIQYVDGSGSKGVWGSDKVTMGNISVQVPLAIVDETSLPNGVFGVGLKQAESTNLKGYGHDQYTYDNFPIQLKKNGIIKKNMYSVYHGEDGTSGNFLFGAIDNAKFEGNLTYNKMLKDKYSRGIQMQPSIAATKLSYNDGTQTKVVTKNDYILSLDTGTTISYLPEKMFNALREAFNYEVSNLFDGFIIPCNITGEWFEFEFHNAKIKVPIESLVYETDKIPIPDGMCVFGILPSSSVGILGNNFLRNAYVVYDLDDLTVGLAQAKFTDEEDIEEVNESTGSGSSGFGIRSLNPLKSLSKLIIYLGLLICVV